jgi:hypothetical protein
MVKSLTRRALTYCVGVILEPAPEDLVELDLKLMANPLRETWGRLRQDNGASNDKDRAAVAMALLSARGMPSVSASIACRDPSCVDLWKPGMGA